LPLALTEKVAGTPLLGIGLIEDQICRETNPGILQPEAEHELFSTPILIQRVGNLEQNTSNVRAAAKRPSIGGRAPHAQ